MTKRLSAFYCVTYVAVAAETTDGADRGISRQVSLFFLLVHQTVGGGGCLDPVRISPT
jgi:hypothetical protein